MNDSDCLRKIFSCQERLKKLGVLMLMNALADQQHEAEPNFHGYAPGPCLWMKRLCHLAGHCPMLWNEETWYDGTVLWQHNLTIAQCPPLHHICSVFTIAFFTVHIQNICYLKKAWESVRKCVLTPWIFSLSETTIRQRTTPFYDGRKYNTIANN